MLVDLIRPEAGYINAAVVYGLAIGLLTLAVPIAVQTLINTIANIGSPRAVIILAVVLFSTLLISISLSALRTRVMEYYERRVYARLTSELSLKTILAPHSFFDSRRNTTITQRYFDIFTLQKNLPTLMVDGFALVLQMLVGFTLVSFYHPMLFALNVMIVLMMYSVWKVWGNRAKRTAIDLSHAKYSTAKWLDDISSAHEFFKSSRHLDYAGAKTEALISHYIHNHERHFKLTFSQVVMYLLLYALASATLLGLGGWLVVQGQLSIGQLVAAELIMSAVFFGISQFTNYLKLYYEMYGAADKIGHALKIPQENLQDDRVSIPESSSLNCQNLLLTHLNHTFEINFNLDARVKKFVVTDQSWIQRGFIKVLKQYSNPQQGMLRLGKHALSDYDLYKLRQAIVSIDRSLIVECSIKEYLRMAAPEASITQMHDVIELVCLQHVIHCLPEGLDTKMSALGAPLQPAELLLLKLAAAILSKPKVVVLNQHFDNIPTTLLKHILSILESQPFSILYFTNHPKADYFDGVMNWCIDPEGVKTVSNQLSQGGHNE
ncbi:ABC transporter ATP-binding protein [Alteromonas sp. a30]|nr:ABC transporter ATP-binding protein [Alteromonas sp. a30]